MRAAAVRRSRVGYDVIDDVLLHVVAFSRRRAADAAGRGVQDAELEVAVAHASPSPVDVEVVAVFKAVAHEGVTTAAACRAIVYHGASLSQLAIDQVVPRLLRIVVAEGQLRAIAEVLEALGDVVGIGSRRAEAVLHLHGASGVEHQVGHGRGIYLVLSSRVCLAHIVPVELGDGLGVHRHGGVLTHLAACHGELVGGNLGQRLCRLLVEVHNLRHGRSHAARIGQLVAVGRVVAVHELRALVPVGRRLVPFGGGERCYRVARGHRCAARGTQRLLCLFVVHRREYLQLLGIAVEPRLHVSWHALGVECPLVGIS